MAMKSNNIVQEMSYDFALSIVSVYQQLVKDGREFVLSNQLLRCGTSVGANIEEAIGAFSRADFSFKMSIAYKEIREAKYWLNLLHDSKILSTDIYDTLFSRADELCRIIGSILKTLKNSRDH